MTQPLTGLRSASAYHAPSPGHCITCSDEGIPMQVIEIRDGTAVCADEERTRHDVAVDLVSPVAIGERLLVHAGVAIAHLQGAPR